MKLGRTLDEKWVKDYFRRHGTVSKWWDPEQKKHPLYSLLIQNKFTAGEMINPKGKKICDVATGTGRFAIGFALYGAKQIFAIDISEEMLEIARKNAREANVADKITFQIGDAENLKFDDNTFDAGECYGHFCSSC